MQTCSQTSPREIQIAARQRAVGGDEGQRSSLCGPTGPALRGQWGLAPSSIVIPRDFEVVFWSLQLSGEPTEVMLWLVSHTAVTCRLWLRQQGHVMLHSMMTRMVAGMEGSWHPVGHCFLLPCCFSHWRAAFGSTQSSPHGSGRLPKGPMPCWGICFEGKELNRRVSEKEVQNAENLGYESVCCDNGQCNDRGGSHFHWTSSWDKVVMKESKPTAGLAGEPWSSSQICFFLCRPERAGSCVKKEPFPFFFQRSGDCTALAGRETSKSMYSSVSWSVCFSQGDYSFHRHALHLGFVIYSSGSFTPADFSSSIWWVIL